MVDVLGQLLANALSAALAPLPLIALILILLSRRAVANGIAFALGWMVGTSIPVVAVVAAGVGIDGSRQERGGGWLNVALGLALLALAAKQWTKRPKHGEHAATPAWMAKLDDASPLAAGGLALGAAVANAKNLPINIAAGTTIAGAGLPGGQNVTVIVIYAIVASVLMITPVLVRTFGGSDVDESLGKLKVWLLDNNAVIMTLLLALLGLSTLGKGITAA